MVGNRYAACLLARWVVVLLSTLLTQDASASSANDSGDRPKNQPIYKNKNPHDVISRSRLAHSK